MAAPVIQKGGALMSAPVSLPIGIRAFSRSAVKVPRAYTGLFARYCFWLRRLEDVQQLREIEPHLARDIGVSPGAHRCPNGYTVDPRPLWGIGLTPYPVDVLPAWPAASEADAPRRRCRTG